MQDTNKQVYVFKDELETLKSQKSQTAISRIMNLSKVKSLPELADYTKVLKMQVLRPVASYLKDQIKINIW